MKLQTTMDKLNVEMDSLLEQRQAFYDHMQHHDKEDLITYYETHGGTKEMNLRWTTHEILCELMDLIYSVDAVIARKEMVYQAMQEAKLQ